MTTIAEWDTEVREKFHVKQCALVEALYKLEEAGFRGSGPGYTLVDVDQDIYLTFTDMSVLKGALSKLVEVFGNYKVEQIWHSYLDFMNVAYDFADKPSSLRVWFQAPVKDFPLEKFSPGCKIIERPAAPSYAVECPLKPEV